MADGNSSTVALLTVFVCFYIISLSTYTYIKSLPNVNISSHKNDFNRLKRDVVKYNTDLWQKNITLNKCCGQNQITNFQNKCESQEYKIFNPSDIVEKLQFFVVDDNMKTSFLNPGRITFAYNFLNPGFLDGAIVVNWVLNDEKIKTNYLFRQQDASLLELDDKREKTFKRFSTNSYCLDENNYFGSGLVAYVNPCIENLCLKKCCAKHWYYNTIQHECTLDDQMNYNPEFYFATSKTEKDIPVYLLIGTPKCTLSDSVTKINANSEEEPVYIQEDGYLLVIDHTRRNYYYYDNKSYCVDLFSDGVQTPYVSGFYCKKEADFMRPADIEINQFTGELKESFGKKPAYGSSVGDVVATKLKSIKTETNAIKKKLPKPVVLGEQPHKKLSRSQPVLLEEEPHLKYNEKLAVKNGQNDIYAQPFIAMISVFLSILL